MQIIEIELSVGQTVKVGNKTITILEIDGEDVYFQIEPDSPETFSNMNNSPSSQPPPK